MLSFYPVNDLIVSMGCGGVNVEYILRDTQGVDETSLAQILASNQLAHTVQSSLQDEGYPAQVTPAETVTVVTAPSAAPTLSPVTINCNSFTQQRTNPIEWLAYCAPTHSPTRAPEIVVTQTFDGKVRTTVAAWPYDSISTNFPPSLLSIVVHQPTF